MKLPPTCLRRDKPASRETTGVSHVPIYGAPGKTARQAAVQFMHRKRLMMDAWPSPLTVVNTNICRRINNTSASPFTSDQQGVMPKQKSTGKRTTIKPKGDARYIRRDSKGRIKESDDVGRSLKKDREQKAKKTVRPGYGDRGDQKRR